MAARPWVLKAGGHFCISDVVLKGELPEKLKTSGEMYSGCVAGALQKTEYLDIIEKCGFKETRIHKETLHIIPDNFLLNYISRDELDEYKKSGNGIYSITVSSKK